MEQREEQQAASAAEMRARSGLVAGTDHTAEFPAATMKIAVTDPDAETVQAPSLPAVETCRDSAAAPVAPAETTPGDRVREDRPNPEHKPDDLDTTVQHVQMPSRLDEAVGFKERRTSLVDVLKKAIEREPDRSDLRMKLLETYYTAAAFNRRGFLEVVRSLERANVSDGDWDKIVSMGRQIASDSELFGPKIGRSTEEDLANCA